MASHCFYLSPDKNNRQYVAGVKIDVLNKFLTFVSIIVRKIQGRMDGC